MVDSAWKGTGLDACLVFDGCWYLPSEAQGGPSQAVASDRGAVPRKKMRRYGPDLESYVREHYAGCDKMQLRRDNPSLYQLLWKAGLAHIVPNAPRPHRPRRAFEPNPLAYYHLHYPGVTRGILGQRDPVLLSRIKEDGLARFVPVGSQSRAGKSRSPFGEDAYLFYASNHPGETKAQIQARRFGLYNRMRLEGLLDLVPPSPRSPTEDDRAGLSLLKDYHVRYPAVPRNRLKETDRDLYEGLRKTGYLRFVPKVDQRRLKRSESRLGRDSYIAYCKDHPGKPRGKLEDDDFTLYVRMRREGTIRLVPTLRDLKRAGYAV